MEKVTVPAGSAVMVSLRSRLSSATNHAGDPFEAETIEPITVDGKLVMKAGARIEGRLVDVVQARRDVAGSARLTLVFDKIEDPRGPFYLIESRPVTLVGSAHGAADREGGTFLVSGAGRGGEIVLVARGREVDLAPGQKIRMEFAQPIILPALSHLASNR